MTRTAQLAFDLAFQPDFKSTNFFESPSNTEAFYWINKWPKWGKLPLLILHGEPGCGKTHLAHMWQQITKGTFLTEDNLQEQDALALVQNYRNLILDGTWHNIPEEKLFHLINAAKESKGYLLLTAHSPPSTWKITLPDLKSRLQAAPTAAIKSPDDKLLRAILLKLFADHQLVIREKALSYLLTHMERSYKGVHDVVEKVSKLSLQKHRKVTLPLLRDVLGMRESPAQELANAY